MQAYDGDDIATFYFVIYTRGNTQQVRGWTDDKNLADFYMRFHNCKDFKLKKVRNRYSEIVKILNENNHDEIEIHHLVVKDRNHKKGKMETKELPVPLTTTEHQMIREECQTLLAARVDYGFIDSAFGYFRDKYQKAFKDILLRDAILMAVHNKPSKLMLSITMDELMVLFRSFSDYFGE